MGRFWPSLYLFVEFMRKPNMKRTTQLLLALAVSFAIFGVLESSLSAKNSQVSGLIHAFVIGALSHLWVKAEASERNAVPPGRSALWTGIFPVVGLPIYFFRTRKWQQALRGCLLAVALLIGLGLAYAIAKSVTKLAVA